jgi:hypothetical protein
MQRKIREERILNHRDAVEGIRQHFGDEFIYINKNGNPAIREDVLQEFRHITEQSVVWELGMLRWRKRREDDPRGVRQVD